MKSIGILIFILILHIQIFENSGAAEILKRHKRKLPLVFHDFGVSQFVCGFGIPVEDLDFESVSSGIVFKSQLPLPAYPQDLRNHTTHNVNGERRSNTRHSKGSIRWMFYRILEIWASNLGYDGRSCVLKTLCDVATIPFDNDQGDLWHEIVHILFTPSTTTDESNATYKPNEYMAAVHMGTMIAQSNTTTTCDKIFTHCQLSPLDFFTKII